MSQLLKSSLVLVCLCLSVFWASLSQATINKTLLDAVTANATGSNLSVNDMGTVVFTVTISGTATVTFQGSADGGVTYAALSCFTIGGTTLALTTVATGQFQCDVAGLSHVNAPLSGCAACTVTVAVQASQASKGTLAVAGTTPNDAAINENPVLIGCQTIGAGTNATTATAVNQRYATCGTKGELIVLPYGANRWSCFLENVTVTTQCQATGSTRNYITSISLSNEAVTAQTLDIVFGTGSNCATGTTALTHKWQFGTVATTTSPFVVSQTFPTPLVPTAGTAICVRPSAATAFGATITGYIAP